MTAQQTLQNKNIVLGITGGIAAYKSPEIVRRLKDQGADVRVVMTAGAKEFITPLTLQAVSGNPVADSLLDPAAEAAMGHIELAKWADLVIIAPASSNTIAAIAAGLAGDLLTTLCIATAAPIAIAPAMNQQMYAAAVTQENIARLTNRGVHIWGPASGEQACGDVGQGRMIEALEVVEQTLNFFTPKPPAFKLLITAGPTREAIDPVRYISNHSSGKMGFAIAKAAQALGGEVTLVSGPVALTTPHSVNRIDVVSAEQMHQQTLVNAPQHDIFIACAAVADYRPALVCEQKIKKNDDDMVVSMVKNPDILADVAALTEQRPFCVGFAAETQDVETYARGKLQRKKLDLIAANNVSVTGQGFNSDDNALTLYWPNGQLDLPLTSKDMLAKQLVLEILKHYNTQH
ncbi:bifunctional phosphopantothenoylcysteine decarboxylase/phosphopantothenate--cysteine ligase CoaBC [Psychrobium sp. 1_MG-2023]|uniref:bifunctional phosphopantothenoylcysteine decarboxylase/phosphopantothenate--cysteine ligase CoaBC n=1 Tax=Psychrobium sp. 1_MG-2023 TaxID=3062624 RepID=UPI000C32EB02|nr:bifunctional phosphopantothenoylcysteine decarboxylase/phosphopantothenate--cysteine ligase CoaBC [Psychrobium sp. 1_MG-2023]MDP2562545.1 bifunctional phosphopantothenoylcysteine decarboxylase/phosphopantothenate--cysteine ligase CoaBC [Psychrobium sp. 1_MG-2023]PKF57964.1 bifunctional phosphopantothenoylcysteine decarboxylase/phosphopantothenate--cysteine ligase CoaBC [Alteromonadales bacterium alter-6D02]